MKVKTIDKKEDWEGFLSSCGEKTFLSSWNWGEFQKAMGNKIWRLGVFDDKDLVATALISKIKARRGTFLLLQHSPSVALANGGGPFFKRNMLKTLLEELKKTAKNEGAIFIRMSSLWERNRENQDIFHELGFKESPMHANAYEATWKLDITPSEEDLLGQMRKTTRYLIRQAIKNPDISCEKSENPDDIQKYQKLNREVAKRQKFVPFSSEYIKNEFDAFSKDGQAVLFFGKYKGEIISAALVIFWSGIAFYHQAASSSKHAKFSIPYLVMWEAIKEAKQKNCAIYDFWGYIDPQKEKKHPWAGPTLFKMGFGGHKKEYVKTQDFPLTLRYWLTFILEQSRKLKRGL